VHRKNLIIGTALALTGTWCAAQTVYRCGNSYGTDPCAGGAVVATPGPAPAAADAARAVKVAQSDAKRADAMEKARLAQEKNAPKAIVIGPATPPLAAASAKGKPAAKAKDFTAVAPGPAKPKK
jgi:hypothetical protein